MTSRKGFNLLRDVLFSKSDELTGACRKFFEKLKQYISSKPQTDLKKGHHVSFYAKEIRQQFRMNPNNLKRYLRELLAYNYLKVASGNKYRGFEYELLNRQDDLKSSLDKQIQDVLAQIKQKSVGRGSVVGQ